MKRLVQFALAVATITAATGCAPEVGSKRWCENLEKKPKGEWSMNEVGDFAKHCVFRDDD